MELSTRVENNINSKETLKFAVDIKMSRPKQELDRSKKKKYNENRFERFDKSNKRLRTKRRESKLPSLKYNNYTLLNTARTNIVIEIRDRNIMNW